MKSNFLILLWSTILLTSCNDDCANTQKEIQTLMKDWYKRKINFPTDMEILTDSSVINSKNEIAKISFSKKNTILHFFTADCDKCINELSRIQSFLNKEAKDTSFEYVFIASASTKIYVLDAIKKIKFSYPIYYEKQYYSFKTMNKLPLSDDLYNTMLLNNKQELILFGAFYDNKKAERLYFKTMECGL